MNSYLNQTLTYFFLKQNIVFADDKCIQYESEILRGGPATSKTSFQSWTKDVSFSDPVLDRYLLSFQNDQAQLFRFQFATVNRNTEEVLLLPTVYSASDLDSLGMILFSFLFFKRYSKVIIIINQIYKNYIIIGSTPRSIGRTIVDQNGNFIFFGDYFSSSDAKKKLFIAKYSPSFTKIWITTMQTAELAQDLFVGDIALLENGDFAIVGGSYGTITGSGATPNINDLQGFYGVVAGNNGTVRWVNQDSSTIQNYGANLLCKGVNLECYTIWKSLVQKTGEVRLYNFGTKAKDDAWTYTFNVRDSDGIILFRNNSYTNGVLVAFFAPSYKDEVLFFSLLLWLSFFKKKSNLFFFLKKKLTISLLNEANDKFESLYSPVQFGTVDSSVTGNLAKTAYYDNNFNLYIIGSSKYNFPTQSMVSFLFFSFSPSFFNLVNNFANFFFLSFQSSNPRGFIAKFQPSSLVYTVSVLSSTGAVSAESATILSEDNILVIGTTKGPLSSGDTLNSVQDIFLATYGPSDTLYGQSCSGDCVTSCSVAYDVNSTITCRSGAFGNDSFIFFSFLFFLLLSCKIGI